ncbi:MAG: ATP-dependent DNA helicase DinG [Cellvibrionaceae bacterium]|nr:ATP-dependent DNA helicase DinG [Cellvibrionaceae bacterium]
MLNNDLKRQIQGAYSKFLEAKGLRPRYGQKLMIADIARTLGGIVLDDQDQRHNEGHICVVEAGTGTGKTVAYLLAALPIAKALGKKLVVSTATVALQEQIVNKDLPDVRNNSGMQFSFALAKGRGRYLCLSKLDNLLQSADEPVPVDPTQALYEEYASGVDEQSIKIYQNMVDALAANEWDGDKDGWADGVEDDVWRRVTTDHRQCTGRRCSNVSSCSFLKARDNIGNVDCIVTNHDLVLADLALGGGAILPAPEDAIYIFDEGHHLPDKALGHFAHHSRMLSTSKWLEQSNKQLAAMLGHISGAGNIDRFAEQLPAAMLDARQQLDKIYPAFQALTDTIEDDERHLRYRFEGGVIPTEQREQCDEIYRAFDRLQDLLGKISRELEEAMEDSYCEVPKVDLENWYPLVGSWQARAEANAALWETFATPDKEGVPPTARWITVVEISGYIDLEVCSSPILASGTLAYGLWSRCCGAVVTSATLTALQKFDRFRMRAGTPVDSCYNSVPSPFDYQGNGTLAIPKEAADAGNAMAHSDSIIELLPKLLKDELGSLVLFSSRRQMREVFEGLPMSWQGRILMQGDKSKQEIITAHRKAVDREMQSVIFGLASFAEGIDLPGPYCSHVVIAKIPFAVPDDPVEASLSEWIEARGGNPFMEITVPDACVRLIQASGRLLRTESDTGQVTLLDNRLLSRRYGQAILNSLPPFARQF